MRTARTTLTSAVLTFHWGTTTFRMLADDSFSDSKLVIGGDSDPLRAGASKYMPQYLMLDPLPFAMEQTAVPTTTEPTTSDHSHRTHDSD